MFSCKISGFSPSKQPRIYCLCFIMVTAILFIPIGHMRKIFFVAINAFSIIWFLTDPRKSVGIVLTGATPFQKPNRVSLRITLTTTAAIPELRFLNIAWKQWLYNQNYLQKLQQINSFSETCLPKLVCRHEPEKKLGEIWPFCLTLKGSKYNKSGKDPTL